MKGKARLQQEIAIMTGSLHVKEVSRHAAPSERLASSSMAVQTALHCWPSLSHCVVIGGSPVLCRTRSDKIALMSP